MESGEHPQRSALRLIMIVVAVTVLTFVVVQSLLLGLQVSPLVDLTVEAAALSVSLSGLLWFVALRPLRADADHERALNRLREGELQNEAQRQEFDSRLHRALEMADTETHAYQVVHRAFERGVPRLSAELLLADSSDAHLKRAVTRDADGAAGCPVESPRACPAIRRAQTLVFSSGAELDACPHLADRQEDRAAVCVPVSVGGRSIGVLHSTTVPDAPATAGETARLEAVATQAGARIGLLRVMESTHLQAATDPLTGLLNRRSFENKVKDLLSQNIPFAVAMADLDHFKTLNDTHGHDAGDRALRLFANVVQRSLRSDDVVSRYGGEEFVIAFPHLGVHDAAAALQRLQEELVIALASGSVPPFTASFGVSHSDGGASLEALAGVADAALFRAKRAGRNCVVIDGLEQDSSPAGAQIF